MVWYVENSVIYTRIYFTLGGFGREIDPSFLMGIPARPVFLRLIWHYPLAYVHKQGRVRVSHLLYKAILFWFMVLD